MVFLPSQLGWHFWPDWAVIDGIRVDYFSPTIYFTDGLAVAILFLVTVHVYRFGLWKQLDRKKIKIIILVLLFIGVNTLFSVSPAVTLIKWIRLLEIFCLGSLFVKNWLGCLSRRSVAVFLGVGLIISSILTIWQFNLQQSVGGWWYYLGERAFSQTTPGIANAFFGGQLVLRPYGSFPHPNVLGGFLGLGLLFVGAVFLREKRVNFWGFNGFSLFLGTVLIVGQIALFLTLSRSAIFSYLLAVLVLVGKGLSRRRLIGVVSALCLVGFLALGYRFSSALFETEPIQARWQYFGEVWKSLWVSPIFGMGLGTAPAIIKIEKISYALRFQPPHSIFLVSLLEMGILGTMFFGIIIRKVLLVAWGKFQKGEALSMAVTLFIFLTGMSDHYWLTLNQGNLAVALIGGMALSSSKS